MALDFINNYSAPENDPRKWVNLALDELLLLDLGQEQQTAVRYVSSQTVKRPQDRYNRGKPTGLFYHTASIKSLRNFFFDYWQKEDPEILEEVLQRTIEIVDKYGPRHFLDYFRRLQADGVQQLTLEELEQKNYLRIGIMDSRVTTFRRTLRKHLNSLMADELLQKTHGYSHLHAVSVHPRMLIGIKDL